MNIVNATTYANAIFERGVGGLRLQDSRDAVLGTLTSLARTTTNKPTSNEVAADAVSTLKPKTAKVIEQLSAIAARQAAVGQISIVMIGETHKCEADIERASAVARSIQVHAPPALASMVLRERGLEYDTEPAVPLVSESELTTSPYYKGEDNRHDFGVDNLWPNQRSSVVAGYIAACLADGNQGSRDLIVVFFGEAHSDIFTEFEYLIDAWSRVGFDWLKKRPRSYYLARSLAK